MRGFSGHLSHRDLMLLADGELSPKQKRRADEHLEGCWMCRARLRELETVLTEFARDYHRGWDGEIPAAEGPHALLRARLESDGARAPGWTAGRAVAWTAALSISLLIGAAAGRVWQRNAQLAELAKEHAIPNRTLTPGVTDGLTAQDICEAPAMGTDPDVSERLKREVLQEYGIAPSTSSAYEIDYLVTPELGGTATLRNLWPQPYSQTRWNAHLKDVLETRLRALVCSGKLDLATAQRDLSRNWVTAYEKYVGAPPDQSSGALGGRRG